VDNRRGVLPLTERDAVSLSKDPVLNDFEIHFVGDGAFRYLHVWPWGAQEGHGGGLSTVGTKKPVKRVFIARGLWESNRERALTVLRHEATEVNLWWEQATKLEDEKQIVNTDRKAEALAAVAALRGRPRKKRNDIQSGQLRRIDGEISPLMSEVSSLKSQLASTERQLADVGTELLAARPQPVKAKVRWGVTHDGNGNWSLRDHDGQELISGFTQEALEHIADLHNTHAVIDAPAGVPSVRDLREIGIREYLAHPHAAKENAGCIHDPMEAAATAIRDAVLAGVQSQQTVREPTPEQVEALARVLYSEYANMNLDDKNQLINSLWAKVARAAFAHIQQPARPKGLPSAEELDRVWVEKYDLPSFLAYATHAIDYLAPYLRDPVGWDPITLEEYTDMRNRLTRGNDWKQQLAKEYDWLRSRIRPVMECTECDRWKGYGVKMEDNARVLAKRIDKTRISMDAARAALEGE
jgi:hypothetical protein